MPPAPPHVDAVEDFLYALDMGEKKPTSEELRREVLELRKLTDRLRKRAEELAVRSAELEKMVQTHQAPFL